MNINKKIVITVCFTAICVYLTILAQNYVSAKSKDVYHILVDVETSKLYLFKNDVLEKEYKCAGGKPSTPSPIGTWTINSKGKWGEGFGGSWMRN
ncbi:MAG TPA: L,D-transpeptidase [Clostridiaceae bacterium]|jgi:hypothetical protein|nr:L,D-transpeptidase [Clostridiaceae bacterium]